jgi:hypothetical protein
VGRFVVSPVALLTLLCACQEPTQITVEVSTDIDCGLGIDTGINVGALGDVDGKPPGSTKSACESSGRIGSLVAVPAGSGPEEVGFRIVTSVGVPLSACETPTEGDSCIVSRCALGYLEQKKLLVPVVQRDACIGVPCDETTTCVRGDCVDAAIDPQLCTGREGCGEEQPGTGGGAGAGGAGCPATQPGADVCDNPGLTCSYGSVCCQCKTMSCGERWECADTPPPQGCPPAAPVGTVQCQQGGICFYCDQGVPRHFFCNGSDAWEELTDGMCP